MRQILSYAVAAAMVVLVFTAGAATTTPAKKKTAHKSTAGAHKTTTAHKTTSSTRKRTSTAHKSSPATTARRGAAAARKGSTRNGAKRTTSWRNRQMAPSPERYKEIQQALVAKGYLKPEDAQGAWNQASIDAMKKFQAEQKLDSTGKINSLSLIALGLGPKHDSAPAKPAETPQEQPAK
jgi:hypothetical protein